MSSWFWQSKKSENKATSKNNNLFPDFSSIVNLKKKKGGGGKRPCNNSSVHTKIKWNQSTGTIQIFLKTDRLELFLFTHSWKIFCHFNVSSHSVKFFFVAFIHIALLTGTQYKTAYFRIIRILERYKLAQSADVSLKSFISEKWIGQWIRSGQLLFYTGSRTLLGIFPTAFSSRLLKPVAAAAAHLFASL